MSIEDNKSNTVKGRLIKQQQTDKQRVKFIEFSGTKNGEFGSVTFRDQNSVILGKFPLNRFGIEILNEHFTKWLEDTK